MKEIVKKFEQTFHQRPRPAMTEERIEQLDLSPSRSPHEGCRLNLEYAKEVF